MHVPWFIGIWRVTCMFARRDVPLVDGRGRWNIAVVLGIRAFSLI
jgi:hypothetical protein